MLSYLFRLYRTLTKTESTVLFVALGVFLIAGSFSLVALFKNYTVEAPAYGGTYVEGMVGQPTLLNPLIVPPNDVDRGIVELVFSDLTELAEEVRTDEKKTTWTVVLKPDAHWSDGEPLTSNDIVFTIETIQNPDARSPFLDTWRGVTVQKLSEREVRFSLNTPYAFFQENLDTLKIAPQHIFGSIPVANIPLSSFNLEPVGSGPYVFDEYKKEKDGFISEYDFVPNEFYSGDAPFISSFVIRFYPDADALIEAFNRRAIDGFGGLDPASVDGIRLNHELVTIVLPRYYAVFFNQSVSEPLKEPQVRQALSIAIDKEQIITDVFHGRATIINGPIVPGVEGYRNETYEFETPSLTDAQQILEEAGWQMNEETGIREKTDGRRTLTLSFDIIVPDIRFLRETVNTIQATWKSLGIALNPIVMNPNDIVQQVIRNRNYQMIIFGNILNNTPDVLSFWHSSERFYPGLNLSLYNNTNVNSILEKIRKEIDADKRAALVALLQEDILTDRPALFLFSPHYVYVAPRTLDGFNQQFMVAPADRFDRVHEWHLRTKRVFK